MTATVSAAPWPSSVLTRILVFSDISVPLPTMLALVTHELSQSLKMAPEVLMGVCPAYSLCFVVICY